MNDQTELELPGTYAPLTLRIRDGWKDALKRRRTSEWGKTYPKDRPCPRCFASFSSKGIARHVAACPAQPRREP